MPNQLTPEQIAQLQAQQGQSANNNPIPQDNNMAQDNNIPQVDNGAPTDFVPPDYYQLQQGMPNQSIQQPQVNPNEIELAKKMLGLDEVERQAKQAMEELNRLKQERVKQEVLAKYPNLTEDIVNKELEKLEKINPQLAEAVKTDPQAFEIIAKATLASIEPNQKPDKITETGGSGNNIEDDLESAIKKGNADEITLGDYILNISKK